MKTRSAVFALGAVGVSMMVMLVGCETVTDTDPAGDGGATTDGTSPIDAAEASSDASNASDASDASESDASDANAANDAADASDGGDSGQSNGCSSPTAPDAGSSCSNEGAACSWGTNPNCPYTYNCTGGAWMLVGSPQPTEQCPGTKPALGATCPLCAYPTGCTYGDAGSTTTLFCDVKPGPEGAGGWNQRP